MKKTLVITTINKPNKNINFFSRYCKKNKWEMIVVGDKKTPKNYKLRYGDFYSLLKQKELKFSFSKICPKNSYSRKNIGYLLAILNKTDIIIETDDDNSPKRNFFKNIQLKYKVRQLLGSDWVNVYLNFLKKKNEKIWPRGLPLEYIYNRPVLNSKKIVSKFYLQQGVCEGNPDVDAIYRLTNPKINIKFKNNYRYSLGKCLSPFNSQNTIWFKKIFPLLYLPVTCTMRATDIWRSLIALNILQKDNKAILFFGTTMFQKRNIHSLYNDFKEEIPTYLHNKRIIEILKSLNLKKGSHNYLNNLKSSYKSLVQNDIISINEINYLDAWIKDCKSLI